MDRRDSTLHDNEGESEDDLQLHTSLDEIEMWLCDVKPNLGATMRVKRGFRGARDVPLYTRWEQDFFASVEKQYESRLARGLDRFPLSGKQLVILKRMWVKLAQAVARRIEDV